MIAGSQSPGRLRQKLKTRTSLIHAAVELVRAGRQPSVAEVAEAAMVHRATAYRYFPSQQALMLEVASEGIHPSPTDVLAGVPRDDVMARWDAVCRAVHRLLASEEPLFRTILGAVQDRWLEANARGDRAEMVRQGRRLEHIDAALQPVRSQMSADEYGQLRLALCMVLGIEALSVLKDIGGIGSRQSLDIMSWAGRALITEALHPPEI